MKNRKGFSLVELIAVIIILGVVMLIAVPSVGKAIDDSRKKAYVEIANRYVDTVRTKVAAGEIKVDNPNVTYYISYDTIKTEHGSQSPYGKWISAYVVAVYNKDKRKVEYYWTSIDDTGHKIMLKNIEEITVDDVIVDLTLLASDHRRIGLRDTVYIINADGSATESRPTLSYTAAEASVCFSYFENSDGTITINEYKIACGKDVIIPSTIDGKTVSTIGTYAFTQLDIETVILSEGITTIEYGAFRDNKIRTVEYPTTLTTIGGWAFAYNQLTEIALRSSASIGGGAYTGNLFDDTNAFIYDQGDYSKIIGYAGEATTIVIPPYKNGIALKTIGNSAFRGMGLTSVSIPSTVEYIEGAAFQGNKLSSINLPNGLKSIEWYAFANNNLTSISIPESVTFVGNRSFNRNLVPKNSSYTDNEFVYARTESGIDYSKIVSYAGVERSVTIPPTAGPDNTPLKTINGASFFGCVLTHVSIPSSVTSIGSQAFNANYINDDTAWIYARNSDGSPNYTKIIGYGGANRGASSPLVIPEFQTKADGTKVYLKTIASDAFREDYIYAIVIPDSVTTIGSWAFRYNYLTQIVIPSKVTSIGEGAFAKEVSWEHFNILTRIVNKSGKVYDWASITRNLNGQASTFATGYVSHQLGNIEVTSG